MPSAPSPSSASAATAKEPPVKMELLHISLSGNVMDDDYLGKSMLALDSFVMRKADPFTGLPRKYKWQEALSFDDAFKMQQPGYLDMEHGYVRNKDGTYYVCCLTDLGTECTGEMVDWWFSHVESTERYKWWHPRDHISSDWDLQYFSVMPENRHCGHYIDHVHKVKETVGGVAKNLEIVWQRPSKFFDVAKFAAAGITACLCGRVYSEEAGLGVLAIGWLVHMVRKIGNRSEMRSRFWLGHVYMTEDMDNVVSAWCVNWFANTHLFRSLKMSDSTADGVWTHCAEEMNCLKAFLPSLYAKEQDVYAMKAAEFEFLPSSWR